ncbi:Pectinesterase inhibitor-like [Abeliophyllum distichum]|uniref:Pectinesterase inhibitor-like n=1 Tax=Abeliophyllum distichum TaxID=126358 RepID=A0ABD1W179_9LAMI
MASLKFNYFSFLFLAIIASVLSYGIARIEFDNDTSRFCKTAQDKDLCKTMISGVTNWHDAIGEAIKVTLSLAKELKSQNDLIIPALVNLQPGKRDSIQKTCKESFETVFDMLKEAQTALAAGDSGTLKTKLSAALEAECVDALSNAGATFPLANKAKELDTKVSICLAIMAQNETFEHRELRNR